MPAAPAPFSSFDRAWMRLARVASRFESIRPYRPRILSTLLLFWTIGKAAGTIPAIMVAGGTIIDTGNGIPTPAPKHPKPPHNRHTAVSKTARFHESSFYINGMHNFESPL